MVVARIGRRPERVEAIILKSGERYSFKVIAKSPYTESELFEDVQETHLLCAVGGVRYADSQGLVRETGFHRVFKERDRRSLQKRRGRIPGLKRCPVSAIVVAYYLSVEFGNIASANECRRGRGQVPPPPPEAIGTTPK